MTGGEVIGRALAQAGCTHAFGIPGGEVLGLMQGLSAAGLDFVLVKHENAGGFMAEGLWHATGAPGVLVATIGPGVANAVNVVANAQQDRVPLIFLTGCLDRAEEETYTHQIFDHQAVLRPIVKASFRAERGSLGPMLDKAVTLATSGQPGPVHIDVPISVAEGVTDETPWPTRPAAATVPPRELIEEARVALAAAKRPIAIAGVDAVNATYPSPKAVFEMCAGQGMPMIATYKAKGLIDENHTLSLGGAGLSPKADRILLPLVEQADVVVLIGYDPIEMRIGWRDPFWAGQTIIDITPVERHHGMHAPTLTLLGDVGRTVMEFGDLGPDRWPGEEPKAARAALAEAFEPGDWGPGEVFDTLQSVMPRETVITADSGAHRILLSQVWKCPGPRQMLQSTALCTMACAVPIAAGYMLGASEVPVVAFVGDAGLEMGLGELATLRDQGLAVIICVLVDESLALIEMKQRGAQRPNLGVDFGATDFPAVAKALGGYGVAVSDAENLAKEAEAALARDTFTVIAAHIGPRAYDGTL